MISRKNLRMAAIALILMVSSTIHVYADGGMWLPYQIKDYIYKDMKKAGLKMRQDKIYSPEHPCVASAVVGFMGENAGLSSYGTGAFISENGLVITNYHVVMSFLERFSQEDRDFLKYGYEASSPEEETLCRGLELKQLIKMEDVTVEMTNGAEGLSGRERTDKINENGVRLAKKVSSSIPGAQVKMQSLFAGNRYIMSVYRVFKDVRMVFAPPFEVARFGVDEDNYRWPRQCGDFAILRVYVDDAPYHPDYHLNVSQEGVSEGDFTMLLGYPGKTMQYIPSSALEKIIKEERVAGMTIKREKMKVLADAMDREPANKFRYSAKYSSVANWYLRWKGEAEGVMSMDLISTKQAEEETFKKWASANSATAKRYGTILKQLETQYDTLFIYNMADMYFREAGLGGAEVVPYIGKFEKMAAMYRRASSRQGAILDSAAVNREAKRLIGLTDQFFGKWDYIVDRDIFKMMLFYFYTGVDQRFRPEVMTSYISRYDGNIDSLVNNVFSSSILASPERVRAFLSDSNRNFQKEIIDDPLYQLAISFFQVNVDKIARQRGALQARQGELYMHYMEGLMEMNGGKLCPDANGSLRITYGKIRGVEMDGEAYLPFTHTSGIIRKSILSEGDYAFPQKMRENFISGESSVVNFIADLHTSSGNSGSPILNATGDLVGICFDRIWEGMASDYRYDPDNSRAIAVDSRYILFLLSKSKHTSGYILDEILN